MALSSIIKAKCKVCNKVAIEVSRLELGDTKYITLVCGHINTEDTIKETDYSKFISSDGKTLRPYQIDGIKFAEAANARCLISDEQGLGKMIQSVAILSLHKDELLPAAYVVKTSLKTQVFHEIRRWAGEKSLIQIINSSKEIALPGMEYYIVTYDILKSDNIFSLVKLKTIILDECQAIKNHLSGRAKACQKLAANTEHIIATSGTPIKNNAGEYFTILNILRPSLFPEYRRFLDYYCDSYDNYYSTKVGGLKRPDEFRELTKDFIIRRTREEVAPELPKMNRQFYHVELNKKFDSAYSQVQKELEELLYASEDENTMTSMIALMTKMRRITGLSKVTECIEFATEHLLENDRKLVIFVHHHDVADVLLANLNKWLKDGNYNEALSLNASLSSESRAEVIRKFKDEPYRIMVASTLAAGEGLNLQFCSDSVMLERQWNPANEEQAEGRFIRIGQEASTVSMTYMLASETIDEYFTELVETKRAIVASTLDNKEIAWDSSSLMKELAEVLVSKGKKKWSL